MIFYYSFFRVSMTLKSILSSTKKFFLNFTKVKVLKLLVQLQKDYIKLKQENAELKTK